MHAEIIAETRPHDESHPFHLMRNAFCAIKSFDVHAQTPPDIMHNWSIGIVHHLFEAIVYEYTRYLRGFTETRNDRQGQSHQARLIPDTAIARLFNETLTSIFVERRRYAANRRACFQAVNKKASTARTVFRIAFS